MAFLWIAHSLPIWLALPSSSLAQQQQQQQPLPGASTFQAPADFPTSLFSSYYVPPSPTQGPQPVVYDAALHLTYPFNLTDPKNIPNTTSDPVFYPPSFNLNNASTQAFVQNAYKQVQEIISGNSITGNCSKCVAALNVGKLVAQIAPEALPAAFIELCTSTGFQSAAACQATFSAQALGSVWTQVLAYADVSGDDGLYMCNSLSSTFCSMPATSPLNTTCLFPKPKPANAVAPKASGKIFKVLHLSDLHIDPRYLVSSESNCSTSFCCRSNSKGTGQNGSVSVPAPLFGAFKCDSPWNLLTAMLESVEPLTNLNKGNNFAVYTGDSAAHDPANQISQLYNEYCENTVYNLMKHYIKGPVYAALGNHDTSPVAIDSPHSLPGNLSTESSWNYNHVSALWESEGWISKETASKARLHYGAYSTTTPHGLKIITLNTDFWYRSNILNFINTTNPDVSGMQKFLIEELQAAEDAHQRVWIIGHVLSGWDGSNPLPNPTNLFYQIIERYSPHVIANVMFGHSHEDQNFIFYANNGTNPTASTALTPAWMGPSVTPLNNLNSGFRLYAVDTTTFDITDAWTYIANVSSFQALPGAGGPTYMLEYSTREAYPIPNWPASAPLNATYWHHVTEAMQQNRSLISLYNTHQGKTSVLSPNCTSDACAQAKVCYMRAGSGPLGKLCPQGFASVQSKFTGVNF